MARVLVVDDERSLREFLEILFARTQHDLESVATVAQALAACDSDPPDLVLTDLRLPDGSGMEVLRRLRARYPETQIIMMTAYATAENAVEAMRLGAYDYLIKPFKVAEVQALVEKALEKVFLIRENKTLTEKLRGPAGISRIVGSTSEMLQVLDLVEKVGPSKATVLITGESGTGKELVARAIHEVSPRVSKPFVAVNCGAIPESLIEAEFFGHVSGAFTGASKERAGLFEQADGGTLLLDEIGELPAAMQVKLLRVLQERVVRRVGEGRERQVDVRMVASTNRDLEAMVEEGSFRGDLFYRLNVVRIDIPPLRERLEDVPRLARIFVAKYARELEKDIERIDPAAMQALSLYIYPGNVRELENFVERAVTLAADNAIRVEDLPDELKETRFQPARSRVDFPDAGIDLDRRLQEVERGYIEEALRRTDGVKKRAAKLLGLSFRSFRYRLEKLTDSVSIEE